MAPFTEDALRAKLSSLNETQESISTVGQWILFHKRYADQTAQVWLQKLRESTPSKKLNLVYLANEIIQQSKIRKKEEWLKAYQPIIVEGTSTAYKGCSPDVQNKMRRVIEVWRQRQVFTQEVQSDIERSLDEIDRSRSSGRKAALGGSLFSNNSVPPELAPVAPLASTHQKADAHAKSSLATANQDYEKFTNPNNVISSPEMLAAGLAALIKKLAVAEGAVAESIKARQGLITGLEKLLETNKEKLAADQAQVTELAARKSTIEGRRDEVERDILKGLPTNGHNSSSTFPLQDSGTNQASDHERPDVEALTPPAIESFTPVGSPQRDAPPENDDVFPTPLDHPEEPIAAAAPPGYSAISAPATAIGELNSIPAADLLRSLTHARQEDGADGTYGPGSSAKKRKTSRSVAEDEFAAFANDGDLDGIDSNLGNLI